MLAMILDTAGKPLRKADMPSPNPGTGQVSIHVHACAVCRTDLHVVDGELTNPKLPLVPGHEIVGTVAQLGEGATRFKVGDRVGVPWLGWTCGECSYCGNGQENLCDRAKFTGYTLDGGYAEYAVADERFCFPIPNPTATLKPRRFVRGSDRLSKPGQSGERQAARHLWLRRRRPHRRANCPIPARARSSLLLVLETTKQKSSLSTSAQFGPVDRMNCRHNDLRPRSSSRRWVDWFRWH